MAAQFRYERLRCREGGALMASGERILGFCWAHPRVTVPEQAYGSRQALMRPANRTYLNSTATNGRANRKTVREAVGCHSSGIINRVRP